MSDHITITPETATAAVPSSVSPVIDMTSGFDLEHVEHPFAAAETVLAAA